MDLKALFEAIGAQAVLAAGPKILKPSGEPKHVYLLTKSDGTTERRDADAEPREHAAANLDTVVAFALRFKDFEAEIWYSRSQVVVLIGEYRRERATLSLVLSEQMKAMTIVHARKLDQRSLLTLLRVTLKDCLRDAGLIEVLRRVKFESGMMVDAAVGHGTASIGKEMRGKVSGQGMIPEYVVFDVPVFENAFRTFRWPVEVAIDPDPSTGTFQLTPLPGQIEAALAAAEEMIAEKVAEVVGEDVPAYFGTP